MKLSSGHFDSNADPILNVLKAELPSGARVLELASGYGQHAGYYSQALSCSCWQPSDINPDNFASIQAYADEVPGGHMQAPIRLDARLDWDVEPMDAILCINLLHVSAADALSGVLRNAARLLAAGGRVLFYGPFIRATVETAPSNLMFDMRLKQRDPDWGIPNLDAVEAEAKSHGLQLKTLYELPSNNVVVVLVKV